MKHIGLFEGIGGFSLAARWMGWETIAWCEWNEFCQKILKQHFKEAIGHGDITKTDFTIYRGQCDILTGGFPCQPYSQAGKRLGKEDDRHLWPEMLRAIREIQPTYVVGENVLGLLNWNGGLVFDEVQTDLEAAGYEVFPYVLPACATNAPHRRDRVWFVAYNATNASNIRCNNGSDYRQERQIQSPIERELQKDKSERNGWEFRFGKNDAIVTDTKLRGCKECRGYATSKISNNGFQIGGMQTEPLLRRGDDGLSNWMDRIKALGNAIVPQVAFQIFKAIELMEVEINNVQPGDGTQCGVGEKITKIFK